MGVCVRVLAVIFLTEYFFLVQASQDEKPVLQLVTMVSEEPCGIGTAQDWERGLEILPGARVAVQEVNRNTDILPGYQLELVEIITEGCSGNLALVQLIQHLTTNTEEGQKNRQTVGIIGPLCSEAAELVATVAGHPGISQVQISATRSSLIDLQGRRNEWPYLFQMLPFDQAYISTTLGLLREFGWDSLTVFCSLEQDLHGCRIAVEFTEAQGDNQLDILYFAEVSTHNVQSALEQLGESGAEITLAFLPVSLASEVLCGAYLKEMRWPEYGWIFPGLEYTDFTATSTCGKDTMAKAIEGLFLLDSTELMLSVDPSAQLVSGCNYSTYYSSYIQELRETANRTQKDLQGNFYASVFYDSVWAFALSLNQSNLHFLSNSPFPRSVIASGITSALVKLSEFSGSTGPIAFDENHNRENVAIQINHIRNKQAIVLGQYNPSTGTITINASLLGGVFPNDNLAVVYDILPLPLTVLFAVITGLSIIFLTVLLLLYIYYRNEPEIKATKLSQFMFLGCYLLHFGTLSITISAHLEIHGNIWRILACQLFQCLTTLGFVTFTATLFVRIMRVYRVFTYFGKTGKTCSNGMLTTVILGFALAIALILAVWAAVDVYKYTDDVTFHTNARPPYYEVDQQCDSEYYEIWITIIALYTGCLLLGVVVLAVKTRKIRRTNFKDTKKLNFLVATLVMIWTLFPALWAVASDPDLSFVFGTLAFQLTALSNQVFIFLPKVGAPLSRSFKKQLHITDDSSNVKRKKGSRHERMHPLQ